MDSGTAFAWVESPLQLLCAVEYAAASALPVRIVPRSGATQLPATADRLRALGLPDGVEIEDPRAVPLEGILLPSAAHWIIGDPWSGMAQSLLAVRAPRRLTLVDDGSMSLRLPAVLAGREPLTRSGGPTAIAELALSRLDALQRAGRLELFSYYPLDHAALLPNRFAWLGERREAGAVSGTVVLGAAAVADGLLASDDYLAWVAQQPVGSAYFPHRRESAEQLAAVARLGLVVAQTGLPIEIVLAGARNLDVRSLPSSAVDTLRILLAGSGSSVTVDLPVRAAA